MTIQEILSIAILSVTLIAFIVGLVTLINNLQRRHKLNSVKLPELDNDQVDLIEIFERKSIKSYKIPTVNPEEVQKIIDTEEAVEDNIVLEEVITRTERRSRRQLKENVQLPEIEDVNSDVKDSFNKMFAEMSEK